VARRPNKEKKRMQNLLIASVAILTLTSCTSIPNVIDINSSPVERPPLVVPNVDEFTTRPIEWTVLTPENQEQVFQDLKDRDIDVVLYAITDDGYKNLSLNMADIIKLVKQQKAIIAAYEKYTDEEEAE
jgi:hypothetical protein